MERNALVNGQSRNYRGSIFLLAILTISILSLLFLSLAENTRITTYFTGRSKHYYQMAIMKELFLAEYLNLPEEQRLEAGVVIYNTGKITYTYQAPNLKIKAATSRYQRQYQEQLISEIPEKVPETTLESKQIIKENDTDVSSSIRK